MLMYRGSAGAWHGVQLTISLEGNIWIHFILLRGQKLPAEVQCVQDVHVHRPVQPVVLARAIPTERVDEVTDADAGVIHSPRTWRGRHKGSQNYFTTLHSVERERQQTLRHSIDWMVATLIVGSRGTTFK